MNDRGTLRQKLVREKQYEIHQLRISTKRGLYRLIVAACNGFSLIQPLLNADPILDNDACGFEFAGKNWFPPVRGDWQTIET